MRDFFKNHDGYKATSARESCGRRNFPSRLGSARRKSSPRPVRSHDVAGGFTLIETLVAVAVLMIAIAGPLVIADKGLISSVYAKNQLMATYLAQDAMESIKNQVSDNEVSGNTSVGTDQWLAMPASTDNPPGANLTSCTMADPCQIDTYPLKGYPLAQPVNCNSAYSIASAYADSNTPTNGDAAQFSRCFYVEPFAVNGDQVGGATVVVEIDWPGDVGGGGGIRLENTLFDDTYY